MMVGLFVELVDVVKTVEARNWLHRKCYNGRLHGNIYGVSKGLTEGLCELNSLGIVSARAPEWGYRKGNSNHQQTAPNLQA